MAVGNATVRVSERALGRLRFRETAEQSINSQTRRRRGNWMTFCEKGDRRCMIFLRRLWKIPQVSTSIRQPKYRALSGGLGALTSCRLVQNAASFRMPPRSDALDVNEGAKGAELISGPRTQPRIPGPLRTGKGV